ncbi:MAG: helix-turn-helix transcriptional regulator [Actinomycetia bacterium]|nr:helix-turn-helix transcriptional regulator [Actinomycetes bacterium]
MGIVMRSECPIAAALDLVGDRWTLVVLRDILLSHRYGFSQIAAEEGIATNILMDRLERLVAAGILERRVDSADRRRRTYLPTERAIGLIPVLLDLVVWGNANTAATGVAEVAEAVRIDRDAVVRDLESTVREKLTALSSR